MKEVARSGDELTKTWQGRWCADKLHVRERHRLHPVARDQEAAAQRAGTELADVKQH